MKILQVCPAFFPAWRRGGVARVVYEISRQIPKRGHDITIYTTDALNSNSRINVEKNPVFKEDMNIFYFKNLSNFLSYKYHFPLPLKMLFKIKEDIKQFDIIHLHGYPHFLNIIVAYYANKYDVPYVIQTHGALAMTFNKNYFHTLFSRLFGFRILKSAKKTIALNETEKQMYKKMGVDNKKIEIVPNGIDLLDYKYLPKRGEFRKRYGLKNSEKIILYLGRLNVLKGIDMLIHTFKDVHDKIPDSKLILIGPDDGYKKQLTHLIRSMFLENDIILTGYISEEEKKMALIDADIFVTPRFSGFPVTFVESCACGTPIITSYNDDYLDWIDNKVGFVVGYEKKQFEESIYKLITNVNIQRRFIDNCSNIINYKLNWEKISEQIISIYKKVV